jgi:hypothetical protein
VAQLVNSTQWAIGASGTVTIPQPATGNTLIMVSYGFATVTAKYGATAWTKRTASLSTMEVACQDWVAAGSGETSITVTLNGSQPVRGFVYELHGLGAFINASAPSSTTVTNHIGTLGGITTTGNALMVQAWTFSTTSHVTAQDRWWGCQPYGYVYENGYWSSKWWGQISLSDLPGAGTYAASSGSASAATCQAGAWAYTDTTGVATNPAYPNSTVAENSITGTHESQWFGVGANSSVAGYCDLVSYAPGATVNMQVDTGNTAFTATIYRLGQYGYAFFGARQVGQVTGTPAVQPSPTVDALGATVCAWSTTATWTIPSNAQPGVYLVIWKAGANSAQGLFVVHSPSASTAAVAVITADQTWQAYNAWGATTDSGSTYTGKNLYGGNNDGVIGHRSSAVSCNRPMAVQSSDAITSIWDSEFALINFLEANGYDVAYYAMTDLEANTNILKGHQVIVVNGHSEYWTLNQRQAVENALLAGSNMASFSANTMLWRVRYSAADTTFRYVICYKDTVAGASIDPGGYTGTWRDTGAYNPLLWREEAQLGQQFLASANNSGSTTWSSAYAALPCYRGTANIAGLTGASTYTTSVATLGEELDYIAAGSPATPTNLVALNLQSYSAVNVTAPVGYPYTGTGTYNIGPTLYMRANGALVFTAGTWRMACATSPYRFSTFAGGGSVDTNVQQMIVNVLADLGAQPQTLLDATHNGTAAGLVAPGPARNPAAYGLGVYVAPEAAQAGGFF